MQVSNRDKRDDRQDVMGRPASQTWCSKGPDGLPAAASAPGSPLLFQCPRPASHMHSEEEPQPRIKVLKSKLLQACPTAESGADVSEGATARSIAQM